MVVVQHGPLIHQIRRAGVSSRLVLFQVNQRSVAGLSQADVVQLVKSKELDVQLRMYEPRTALPASTPAHSLAAALPPGYVNDSTSSLPGAQSRAFMPGNNICRHTRT
jgi:hypothetical protein